LLENMCVQSFLFAPTSDSDASSMEQNEDSVAGASSIFNSILGGATATVAPAANNPTSMATKFGVNYLGKGSPLFPSCGAFDMTIAIYLY
jgi:hypothetical protein